MYQTPHGRPWMKFTWNGNKYPIWYYWCFRDKEKTFKWPHEWKGKRIDTNTQFEGWLRFEGGDPEIKLGKIDQTKWKELLQHPDTIDTEQRMRVQERIDRAERKKR